MKLDKLYLNQQSSAYSKLLDINTLVRLKFAFCDVINTIEICRIEFDLR